MDNNGLGGALHTEAPIALGRFQGRDGNFVGVVTARGVTPLDEVLDAQTSLAEVLASWEETLDAVLRALGRRSRVRTWIDPEELSVLPPVVPGQVLHSGANYRTHVLDLMVAQRDAVASASESPAELRRRAGDALDERARRGSPYVFVGLPSSVTGPFDDVVLPHNGSQLDWELELAAVIGRPAFRVDRDHALQHVAGWTIANDLTLRERVFRADVPGIGTDWLASKCGPGMLPIGPLLVPSRFVRDPMALQVTLRLNAETMQDETTADMMFDVTRLIEYTSSIIPLMSGDLLLTGSPAGNGVTKGRFLQPGDVLEGSITGLGRQRNVVVDSSGTS